MGARFHIAIGDVALVEKLRRAEFTSSLQAHVINRRALRYTDAATPFDGRPRHVRAGSGLNWVAGKLAVLQDDALFIGLVDPVSGAVTSIALPPDAAGHRLYHGKQGKARKPDFECSVVYRDAGEDVLVAFGSGSTTSRERVAVVRSAGAWTERQHNVSTVPAPAFYTGLREDEAFSGSELNIEGSVLVGGTRLVLFQRGNGAPRGELAPVNSTCEISWLALWGYLNAAGRADPPRPQVIVNYDLGSIGKVKLTFTDATSTPAPGVILYVAGAEDSPNTYLDGEVVGTGLGVISGDSVQWGHLFDEQGECLKEKVEGIAVQPTFPDRAYICIDPDDASRPTELCEIELRGPWPWLQ